MITPRLLLDDIYPFVTVTKLLEVVSLNLWLVLSVSCLLFLLDLANRCFQLANTPRSQINVTPCV